MSDQVSPNIIRDAVLMCLDEAFENVHGYFLDKGTSLFETLEGVTADEASQAASSRVATLAAQVNHTAFYLDATIRFATTGYGDERPDWEGSWRVTTVNEDEWDALRENLRLQYGRVQELVRTNPVWNEMTVGGAIAMVAHCAYHLGEIRQALGVIRATPVPSSPVASTTS
jgi:hypothetical protein